MHIGRTNDHSPQLTRRAVLGGGGATAAAALLTTPALLPSPAAAAPTMGRVLARNLQVPWGLAFLPNGDALVGERITGHVHRVDKRGGRRRVGTLRVDAVGEGGLLGIALHPRFAENRWVYFYLTRDGGNRIIRKRFRGGELGRGQTVLAGIPGGPIHNGGRLRFGPDGLLYVGTGDTDTQGMAQDTSRLGGKILRITPRGAVPPGNPFGNPVWTYGHRNVQGLDFDGRGRLWASELGYDTTDELNRIRPGRNYGWPIVEGGDGPGPLADPFATWSPTTTCSPSGIAAVRGRIWVGALRGECLWSVRLDGPDRGRKARHFHQRFGRIRTVERAPDGSLWITTSNNDGSHQAGPKDDRVIRVWV